jgi:hypothetical protein
MVGGCPYVIFAFFMHAIKNSVLIFFIATMQARMMQLSPLGSKNALLPPMLRYVLVQNRQGKTR